MAKAGINIPGLRFVDSGNFLLIAGPCVVESEDVVFEIAGELVKQARCIEKNNKFI
jgi:3-deoxy-D-manno-octulosonic acid (KDO) 8-phosphate synthase